MRKIRFYFGASSIKCHCNMLELIAVIALQYARFQKLFSAGCQPVNTINKLEVGDVRLRYTARPRTPQVTFEQGHDGRGDHSVLQAGHEPGLVRLYPCRLPESCSDCRCRARREEQPAGQVEVQPVHRRLRRSRDRKPLGRQRHDRPPLAVPDRQKHRRRHQRRPHPHGRQAPLPVRPGPGLRLLHQGLRDRQA